MKKLILLLLTLPLCASAQNDIPADMQLNAHDWCRSVIAGWNLGNSLESCDGTWNNTTWTYSGTSDPTTWETRWGNPRTTRQMISDLRTAGFNAIRIPVLWYPHVTDTSTMDIDPTWLARVKEVVDWCIDEGMYVVLNTHHEQWLELNPTSGYRERNLRMLGQLWTNIAEAFANYDSHLAFAGTNEVTGTTGSASGTSYQRNWGTPTADNLSVQNAYLQTFVDAVRATGGNNRYRNLIVQTYACDPYKGISSLVLPTDVVEERLIVEFHYYNPYEYCGSGQYYYWGTAYKQYGSIPSSNEQTIEGLFSQLKSLWWDKGLGVMIGEYGVTCHYDATASADVQQLQQENQQYYLKTLVQKMRSYGFAGMVWDNAAFGNGTERFGIFRRSASGLTVGNPYFLKGIMEGAEQEYVDPAPVDPSDDPYAKAGTTVWSGRELLAWGDGLQLTVPASYFTPLTAGDYLVLYYDNDPTASYSMVQFFYGDWSANPQLVTADGTSDFQFDTRGLNGGLSSGSFVTPLTIPDTSLPTLQQRGLVLQGYGCYLTRVVVCTREALGIRSLRSDTSAMPRPAYNLWGQPAASGTSFVIRDGKVFAR